MKRLVSLFDPRRIAGQIALLVLLAVILVQAIFVGALLLREPMAPDHPGRPLQDRFAAVLRLVDSAPDAAAKQGVIDAAAIAFPTFHFSLQVSGEPLAPEEDKAVVDRVRLFSGVPAIGLAPGHGAESGADAHRLIATLSDGTKVSGSLDLRPGRPPEASILLVVGLVFMAVTLSIMSAWAARALASPLTRFAAAARDFSLDTASSPLPEGGPREVRMAARALNRMQGRIRRMVEDRTRMLAAISHDLRTPITRLRLRAEFITDEAVRTPMLRDLDQMETMTSGALSFLSPGQADPVTTKLDLSAILATIADDFAETGHDVSFTGPDRLVVPGHPDELVRAVTNLVENATRYAKRAVITLRAFPGLAEIDVEDDGPGIPEAERSAVVKPFVRGDTARTLDGKAGFGLGLSIARSVAERHGGRLSLFGAQPHGLLVRLTLPRSPEAMPKPDSPQPSVPLAAE